MLCPLCKRGGTSWSEPSSWMSPRQNLEGDPCLWRCSDVTVGTGQPPSGGQTPLFQIPLLLPSHMAALPHSCRGTYSLAPVALYQPHIPKPSCLPHGTPHACTPSCPILPSPGWVLSVCCFSSLLWQSPTAPWCNWPQEGWAVPVASVQLLSPPCTQEGSEVTCGSQGVFRAR